MAKSNLQDKTGAVSGEAAAPKFTLSQLCGSKRFTRTEKMILGVVLDSGGEYTIGEAKAAIEKFLKKEVV